MLKILYVDLTGKYQEEVDKAKIREQDRLSTIVNSFSVIPSDHKIDIHITNEVKVESMTVPIGVVEKESASQLRSRESVKGTIFDDNIGFRCQGKRYNPRQELAYIIDDLEIENESLQNENIATILERLKEVKKQL